MAAVNNSTMLTDEMLNDIDRWLLDYLDAHEWATPALMRAEYNESHETVSRRWVSRRLTRLAEHGHIEKVNQKSSEYRLVEDPRDG
jgi:hypothetical protein